jgi:hypothetical protein
MKKLILATALIAAAGLGGVAVAQTTTDPSATATVAQTNGNSSNTAIPAEKQVPAPGSRNCVQETGSHIRRHDQACLPVNGNSYSKEDLDRTGQPDIARALQQLDPSVQISGH